MGRGRNETKSFFFAFFVFFSSNENKKGKKKSPKHVDVIKDNTKSYNKHSHIKTLGNEKETSKMACESVDRQGIARRGNPQGNQLK